MTGSTDAIGVIAGAGRFPFMVAQGAKRAGRRVVIVGLRGLADPGLIELADSFHWAGMARVGRWCKIFNRSHVHRAIMAGYVRKDVMYGRFQLLLAVPDWVSFKLWVFQLRDKRNDAILGAVADVLATRGVVLENAVQYCPDAMACQGLLAGGPPTERLQRDIEFGWRIAKELGRLDIGQAVAVKETEVIAIEAIEGTDRMIERAGVLCSKGGWCLVKVAKPNQDMRFDIPTIGPDTIDNLARCGASTLVIEADKTVIIEREAMIAAARKSRITIVARKDA